LIPAPLRSLFFTVCLLAAALTPSAAEKIPDIHAKDYVTDLAGVLSGETVTHIDAICAEVEQKAGAQIAVVTVRSLEDQPISNYAHDLYRQLGVGGKKDNRGVLILLAPQDRKYRVEVGYGLEPVINDARAGDIGRAMVPSLRAGDYSGAVEQATDQVAQLIAADRGVALSTRAQVRQRLPSNVGVPGLLGFLFLVGLVVVFLIVIGRASRGGGRGGGGGGLWWIGPVLGSLSGGFGGSSSGGGFGGSSGGFSGGFGGFGGGSSGGGGAEGSW
jgi:uncharacterized protein